MFLVLFSNLSVFRFYLLNVDCIAASMQVYKNALEVRKASFGGDNLHVALAHEDLAYATYVHEYSSGKFGDARRHAEKSMEIMIKILPKDHLFLASSKRVLALILEEIAIDSQGNAVESQLLIKSEDLHLFALNLAKLNFGECNVQTAKHYGNLGRLYQVSLVIIEISCVLEKKEGFCTHCKYRHFFLFCYG